MAGIGYKIFRKGFNKELKFQFFPYNSRYEVPTNKWLSSYGCELITDSCDKYPEGFHIYLAKPSRNLLFSTVIVEVKFRYPVATGYQNYLPVVVARAIFIKEESNETT
jgi:hypothetical protein